MDEPRGDGDGDEERHGYGRDESVRHDGEVTADDADACADADADADAQVDRAGEEDAGPRETDYAHPPQLRVRLSRRGKRVCVAFEPNEKCADSAVLPSQNPQQSRLRSHLQRSVDTNDAAASPRPGISVRPTRSATRSCDSERPREHHQRS